MRVREGEAGGGRQVAEGGGHQDCADRVTAKQKEEEAKESGQDPNCRVRQRTTTDRLHKTGFRSMFDISDSEDISDERTHHFLWSLEDVLSPLSC